MRYAIRILALVFPLSATQLLAQGLQVAAPAELGFDPAKLSSIEVRLQKEADDNLAAGASALLVRNGRVAFFATAGHADREAGTPMKPDTIVRIASMTKPVTSVAVMILVDEGKLALDDPLAKYLPEFSEMKVLASPEQSGNGNTAATVPAKTPITIRHLLTHTSGISYRFIGHPTLSPMFVEAAVADGLSETSGTMAENVKRLARVPLLWEPGTKWNYGLNTDVLGRVVEVVSGQTLDAFFRERLFKPLGMNDTHFILPAEKRDRLATVYGIENGKPLARHTSVLIQRGPLVYSTTYPTWDDNAGYYSGGAGLVSTLGDYARFLQMLLNRGELDGQRILEPKTVDAMTSNQIGQLNLSIGDAGNGIGFGYGFGVVTSENQGPTPLGSYSWGGFFSTMFWVDPKNKLAGLLFTQTHPAGNTTLSADFQRLTYEALAK
jgi:CubicO group peptidase (beta-lactamase class C family)